MPPAQCQQRGCRGQRSALSHQHQFLRLLFLVMATSSVQGSISIPEGLTSLPPVIIHGAQPASVLAFSPEDIALKCKASGTPEPSYRWEKDGKLFAEMEGDGTLFGNKSLPLDFYEGEYRCYAANELGTVVSDLITVTAGHIPVMPKEKQTFRKVEGESLVMPCDPPPDTPPSHKIYWMDLDLKHLEMSERVTPGLDGYLYFANVIPGDERNDYTCHVRFQHHMISKEPITLRVNQNALAEERKPHIARPAKADSYYMALRGQSFNLECIPYGLPTPTVTWKRKDGNQVKALNTKNYGRYLHFKNISSSDDGEYECIAENLVGSTSHRYTLQVEAAPYFTKEPQSLMYAPGETVRLECQAEGIPTPVVTWSINGVPISDVDEPRRTVTKGALILTDVKFSDTAVYQCEAVNKHGITHINTYIYVIELPPQILTEDRRSYMKVEGKTANLECNVFGSPRPQVLWEDPRMEQAQSHPRISQTVYGSLRITDVSAEDSGLYTCSILKSNLSISAILEVLNKTEIVIPPEDQTVKSGDHATLTCKFQIDPRLDRSNLPKWLKNGKDISESAENDKYTIFPDGSLKITSVTLDDAGSYTCKVTTSHDEEKATATITVVDKPSPPIDLKIFDLNDRSLSLSWTPGRDNNSPVTEYLIEMNEEQHGDRHTWEEVKRIEADVNKLEIPLRPYGTYRFRVVAVNEIGGSRPSHATEPYTTPPAIPEHFPKHVKSASTEPDKLVITWEEMDKRNHYGPDFKYKVSWRQSVGNGPDWHHQEVSDHHFVVNNTKTFTPFEIKVQAINNLGEGPESPPRIGHSGEDTPTEAPTGVTVSDLNGMSASVKWNPVSRDSVRGHLLGYKIHVTRVGTHGAQRRRMLEMALQLEGQVEVEEEVEELDRMLEVRGATTELTVTGLQFYSSYDLTVTAFNSKGDGPPSEPYAFKTPEGAPGPPIFLEFDSPSESELTLRWRPPLKPNGILTGYRLQYGEIVDANGSAPLMQDQDIGDANNTDITLTKLNPQRYYYFYLQGRTSAGLGEAAKLKGATMLDGVPPTIINVTVADTYANLSWVPGERHRNIGFRIHFLQKSAGRDWELSEQVNTHQGFYQLTNLQPGTDYHLRAMLNNFTYWEGSALTRWRELSPMSSNFATQGWFIGLISASLLLLLILLILCLIKRSKGGKYSVKEKEEGQGDSEGRPIKDEAFGEYSDNDEKRTMSQPSLCVESKLGSDDSLAEYGDSVDIQFNEDGSFIGQYSGRREAPIVQGGPESSGATSPVNNMPPQSISFNNSVTGILDRSN
ncbi:neural cell adhesion molecule L1.1-like isoform X2 [Sardina pilchardus]|uniref:neural cell adhesion molecule L1.1-like isoform X2 n=1 Tax=Sardina pilchardus TaxID=27697 RepID=UPI002E0E1597